MKRTIISALAVMLAAACSGTGDDTGSTTQRLCGDESRADDFVSGMSRTTTAGMFEVRLVDVTVDGAPKPPDRGNNLWTFEVVDASGTAVTDAMVQVRAWMPDHGHGTNPLRHSSRSAMTTGQYEVGTFDLFMGGFWEFKFMVESGGTSDEVEFGFCVEG